MPESRFVSWLQSSVTPVTVHSNVSRRSRMEEPYGILARISLRESAYSYRARTTYTQPRHADGRSMPYTGQSLKSCAHSLRE